LDGGFDWGGLRERVLERIVPSRSEVEALERFREETEGALSDLLGASGFRAVAEVQGSAARGTWLAGEEDVDVFIVLDAGYDRGVLPEVLDVVKGYVGEGWVEAYAEHPYIRAEVDGFSVDFVPCFRVARGGGLISATDRSPLHTEYLRGRLTPGLREEARLLKRFMKGVGAYGAEVRVGGFSGYLCELLAVHYGSLEAVLRGAGSWRRGEVVDAVGGSDVEVLRRRFREPLIVPDPVDPGRNVASAVSETVFWSFTEAARAFLGAPSERFFFPLEADVDASGVIEALGSRGSAILFVLVEDGDVDVPDVLWGQLYRAEKALCGLLEKAGFDVYRSAAWSDESSLHVIVFELGCAVLPGVMRRVGPPVRMVEDGRRFVEAHLGAEGTVSGPWIEGDRWWVETVRPEPEARGLVESALADGGRGVGVSRRLGEKMRDGLSVLLGEEVAPYVAGEFARFLFRFLDGRPVWLV